MQAVHEQLQVGDAHCGRHWRHWLLRRCGLCWLCCACAHTLMHMSSSAALFLLPIRPEDPEPAVRVKIAMTLIQARVSQPRSVQGMAHALGIATPQVLGLIKDYAVQWRPPFLIASMSYFDILNVGVEMTAPACGANNVRPHAAPVACASHRRGTHTLHRWTFTRRTLPPCCCLRAPSCCASHSGASWLQPAAQAAGSRGVHAGLCTPR